MERGGRALWNCADSFAASKTTQQQRAFYWASMAFFAFFGLLRTFRAAAPPPHGQMTCIPHPAAHRLAPLSSADWAAPNGRDSIAATNTLMLAHLDTAQWGASPPPRRFTVATINPLRRPPHPLQVHRGSSAPLLFMQGGDAKRLMSWHKRARARRS